MEIYFASDHAGFPLKQFLVENFQSLGIEAKIVDLGTNSEISVDYPDFAHALAEKIKEKPTAFGVLVCGSGNGVCMTANKHQNIRAALAWNPKLAELAKRHNNANVICFPGRFIEHQVALEALFKFLSSEFEDGRHQRRIEKIPPK